MRGKIGKISLVVLTGMGLLWVRMYESIWFYDPFLKYYTYDYLQRPYPDYELGKLMGHYFVRFALNTALSVVILRTWFGKTVYDRIIYWSFAGIGLLVLVLIALHLMLMPEAPMFLFYLRRFAIQPIWLLVCTGALLYFSYVPKTVDS